MLKKHCRMVLSTNALINPAIYLTIFSGVVFSLLIKPTQTFLWEWQRHHWMQWLFVPCHATTLSHFKCRRSSWKSSLWVTHCDIFPSSFFAVLFIGFFSLCLNSWSKLQISRNMGIWIGLFRWCEFKQSGIKVTFILLRHSSVFNTEASNGKNETKQRKTGWKIMLTTDRTIWITNNNYVTRMIWDSLNTESHKEMQNMMQKTTQKYLMIWTKLL